MGNGEKERSVILGFSGGIDSTAAARKLVGEGWNVTALTLDMTGDASLTEQAAARAREMGIAHATRDAREAFASITDYFIRSYAAGRTPAPCALCNTAVKWRFLMDEADRQHADAIATGHYFNIREYGGRLYVARADDTSKDQSYYLWGLSQTVLSRAITPMGHVIKSEIKSGLADGRESMGLCFLRGKSCRDYIAERCPDALRRGDVVNENGRKIGSHDGTAFYTVGQKRGFEIETAGKCVVAIDARRNLLVAGDEASLYRSVLEIDGCNIVDRDEFLSSGDIRVVIRGIGRNPRGYMRRAEPLRSGFRITLDDPAWAPAAGQPAVFYRGDRVIGGGIVEKYY